MLEIFFRTHAYLMEHFNVPVRRSLMDTIDWSYRLIGIRGPRGVGRTSFLLQHAKDITDIRPHYCLYVNLNNFYFQGCGLVEFAGKFVEAGGHILLLDQVFKLPEWQKQLCDCYKQYPFLRIVYTTTSVEPSEEDTSELNTIARTYVLHGFSFREFINYQTGNQFQPFTLDQLLRDHETIEKSILQRVRPWQYFEQYLNHGYYPFYLENQMFTEALLKAMNMMIETDLLFNKQIELKYLSRIKRLLYLIAINKTSTPNISLLSETIGTSRATVMNYLKYLEEARLINMIYKEGDSFPKKPAAVMLHDTNLIYSVYTPEMSEQKIMETFFVNTLWRHHTVNKLPRDGYFRINKSIDICVCDRFKRTKSSPGTLLVRYNTETGRDNEIPLWIFGFLY